jgi:hypothetical protein
MIPLLVSLLIACGGRTTEGPGLGSCPARAKFAGRTYAGHGGVSVLPVYGRNLGTAVMIDCEGGQGFEMEAVEIVGVDPRIAFATPDSDERAIYVAEELAGVPRALEVSFRDRGAT